MTLSQSQSFKNVYYILAIKSFLIWTFALTVCLLIIGFPLIILMVTIGSLAAVVLQSVLPVSAVLVVASTIIGFNVLGIMLGAAILTLKGVHPQEVSWLRWLHGEADPSHTSNVCRLSADLQCERVSPLLPGDHYFPLNCIFAYANPVITGFFIGFIVK